MKIKVKKLSYEDVLNLPREKHIKPPKQSGFFRWLMKTLSVKELKDINFKCKEVGMEKLSDNEPAFFLMNHSSFTDLQIAATLLQNRPYHIVMTNDGMIGKSFLMRKLGCIPTRKFITDVIFVKDASHVVKKYNSSILMYPEASYSFDGTMTPLPDSLGKMVKLLNIPVIMIRTYGAFLRDPLYNNLQKRKVDVSVTQTYLLSKEEIKEKSVAEINDIINKTFEYNHFKEQIDNKIKITEPFRADSLERVLYKCQKCGCEGRMLGKGISIKCDNCGDTHELSEEGKLIHIGDGESKFELIPDWYNWERQCVREEILEKSYKLDTTVNIKMLVDSKYIYDIGEGRLVHDVNGFMLTNNDKSLVYKQGPKYSYSLYADYYWYEIGDVISIGDMKAQYYCFPDKESNVSVAKARLATEEMYKLI